MSSVTSREKLYRIGEIMEYTGLSRQTIDYYTKIGLIHPVRRTKSKHRLYGEDTFERIKRIAASKEQGSSLEEIKAAFDNPQQELF